MAFSNNDLQFARHRERQVMEDYAFMIESGETHENALRRIGIGAEAFRKMRETIENRNRKGIA